MPHDDLPIWLPVAAGRVAMGGVLTRSQPRARRQHLAVGRFWIMRDTVTNAQYGAFCRATGARAPAHWQATQPPRALREHPVTYIDWSEAGAYAHWAGARLPSELECSGRHAATVAVVTPGVTQRRRRNWRILPARWV